MNYPCELVFWCPCTILVFTVPFLKEFRPILSNIASESVHRAGVFWIQHLSILSLATRPLCRHHTCVKPLVSNRETFYRSITGICPIFIRCRPGVASLETSYKHVYQASKDGLSSICPAVHFRPHLTILWSASLTAHLHPPMTNNHGLSSESVNEVDSPSARQSISK